MTETSTLSLEAYLPYRLAAASNAVSRLISRAYETRFGLRVPEWRLLVLLNESGPATQAALVGASGMDKVSVSRAAQVLFERRLVSRAPNTRDGRSHHLAITEAGRHLVGEVTPEALRLETLLLHDVSMENVERLMNCLSKLETAANALSARRPEM